MTEIKKEQRTPSQNAALHLYFRQLAEALNFAGLDMRKTLTKRTIEIPWNEARIKDALWVDLQRIMTKKEHTSDLNTKEVSEVYETLNRWTASQLGVSVPFPSREE